MSSSTGVVLGATLVVLALVSCAYDVLILASIPRSDTATGGLIALGLEFAIPGRVAAGIGAWLLRRTHRTANRRPERTVMLSSRIRQKMALVKDALKCRDPLVSMTGRRQPVRGSSSVR